MPKISITLPNITEVSMEAEDASEMRQVVGIFKNDLLKELVELSSNGTQAKDVPGGTGNDISVPSNGSRRTPLEQPAKQPSSGGKAPFTLQITFTDEPPPETETAPDQDQVVAEVDSSP